MSALDTSTDKDIKKIINIVNAYPVTFRKNATLTQPITINYAITDGTGTPVIDFMYLLSDNIPTVSDTKNLILDKTLNIKYTALESKLYILFGCQLTINKINDVYKYCLDVNGQQIYAFKEKMDRYESFFKTSIRNFLRMVNALYYKSPGVYSGLDLPDCIKIAKKIYDSSVTAFDQYMSTVYQDSKLVDNIINKTV
jgi:hypothetical protein